MISAINAGPASFIVSAVIVGRGGQEVHMTFEYGEAERNDVDENAPTIELERSVLYRIAVDFSHEEERDWEDVGSHEAHGAEV
jgi:hypothetical protein